MLNLMASRINFLQGAWGFLVMVLLPVSGKDYLRTRISATI